jgi:hypothetical protein
VNIDFGEGLSHNAVTQTPDRQSVKPGSRGLSGRNDGHLSPPRASAFGLSPGLGSPGPLGRWVDDDEKTGAHSPVCSPQAA